MFFGNSLICLPRSKDAALLQDLSSLGPVLDFWAYGAYRAYRVYGVVLGLEGLMGFIGFMGFMGLRV